MIIIKPTFKIVFISLCFFYISTFAQDSEPELDNNDTTTYIPSKNKGFHAGLYVGAFWANKNTAYVYDGYGFDINGQRNTFGNSILYNQIVNVYGGGNGGVDYIAQLLNVNHGDWYFNEQDMPFNLKYTTSYLVGLNTRYKVNKKSNLTLYQRIIGNDEKLNLMVEGGLNVILSKAQKNQAILNANPNSGQNNITIDLMSIYNQSPYNYYSAKYLIGGGIGFYGGIGIHLTMNPKYTIQLLYSPSFDRVNMGYSPQFKLQHGVGLRIYYNLS